MPRLSHRRRRRIRRLVLAVAISVCLASIVDFGYNAYQQTNFPIASDSDLLAEPTIFDVYLEGPMQLDAIAALVAAVAILGMSVKLAKIPHRRKRLLLGIEAAMLALLVVTALQWTLWERPWVLGKRFRESKDENRAEHYDTTPHTYWPDDLKIPGDKSP